MRFFATVIIACILSVSIATAQSSRKNTFGPKEESKTLIPDMYKDNRKLLIFANNNGSVEYDQQIEYAEGSKEGYQERGLITYSLFDDDGIDPRGDVMERATSAQFREKYDIPRNKFMILLLDRNDEVLMKSDQPVAMELIYDEIDDTPLRKKEKQQADRARKIKNSKATKTDAE